MILFTGHIGDFSDHFWRIPNNETKDLITLGLDYVLVSFTFSKTSLHQLPDECVTNVCH